MEDNTRPEDSS